MRTLRLGRTFDAVFVHDAIEYMTTEADLRAAVATAYEHCRPGGVAVLVPDDIAENFEPSTEHGGRDAPDGRGVRYLSWSTDPDPADSTTTTEYAFLLRSPDGSVQVAHDTHTLGLFGRETWLRVLAEAGFEARSVAEVTSDDRLPREFFVGRRRPAEYGRREIGLRPLTTSGRWSRIVSVVGRGATAVARSNRLWGVVLGSGVRQRPCCRAR